MREHRTHINNILYAAKSSVLVKNIRKNAQWQLDALNVSLSLDNNLADMWYPLDPKFNIYEATNPYEISGNISVPKPVVLSTSVWLTG